MMAATFAFTLFTDIPFMQLGTMPPFTSLDQAHARIATEKHHALAH
jgi:hypothetical protein